MQRLGHDALPGEGRVAVQQQRQHARVLAVAQRVLLRAHHALDDRVHELEVARVRGERDGDRLAGVGEVRPASRPRWYLTSPEPWYELGVGRPRTPRRSARSGLPIVFASTFSRPRCDMPITTSRSPRSAASFRIAVEQRDQRLAALEREALVADVLARAGSARSSRPRPASRARASCSRRRAPGSCAPTPSGAAATPCARGRRCTCTRRRSCRSRSRAGCRGSRAASRAPRPRAPPVMNSRSRSQSVRP